MTGQKPIGVLVVDDHPIMRVGVNAIINTHPLMHVVGQTGSGEEAIEEFRRTRPSVTLMDLRLPGMSGVDAIHAIRREDPRARFVVLTTYEGDEDIFQALQAGAQAYLIKGMPHAALVNAIERVHAGLRFLPPPVERSLAAHDAKPELSSREREVLALLVRGNSNRQIAGVLGISEATVKCHASAIFETLGAKDRTQAVLEALRRGLFHL